MRYDSVWQKVLTSDETVEVEFSVGDQYRKTSLIIWGIVSVLFIFAGGLGILMFLVALFYYGFYLKAANAYAFTNKRVLIHRGWLSTHTISVDYPKITDVHVTEPFFDRILMRSGNLSVNTAGTTTDQISLKHIQEPYEIKKQLDSLKG
jgi:uncharacterized membrane protein YdbT with pleckstrin-like domain